ncbi:MAG TPA: TerC/Alx family metal homeostasis membrane protein [Chitinophagaceae bacterium]|nr:TerC/Alx family metal homeostasis membrane protein [Chitinophagaceae bacterium]
MSTTELSYWVFGAVLVLAVILDLGLLSKRSKILSIKQAFYQTLFWISLAFAFGVFVWYTEGKMIAVEYISAYLMEWSLSIDNIFVFILIFSFFGIKKQYYGQVLLLGILMAIVFRIIFITIGIALVAKFGWLLYVFGAFLVFTGVKMFFVEQDDEYDPSKNKVYVLLQKLIPITHEDAEGKFTKRINGKKYFTMLFVVIILLATTDIVFALDSIPAVFAITQNKMVIYTSNIFAVLGLRSLFFLLRGAVSKFDYLQQGIAIVLVFIGVKMLIEYFDIHIPIWISLSVIVFCLVGSIIFSIYNKKIDIPEDATDDVEV